MKCDCCHRAFSPHKSFQFSISPTINYTGGPFGATIPPKTESKLCSECYSRVNRLLQSQHLKAPYAEHKYDAACEVVRKQEKPNLVILVGFEANLMCAICHDFFNPSSIILKPSDCVPEHIFHHACLLRWSAENSACPLCRKAFVMPVSIMSIGMPIEKGMRGWHDTTQCENCGKHFLPFGLDRIHCRKCGRCLCHTCSTIQKLQDGNKHYVCRRCPETHRS